MNKFKFIALSLLLSLAVNSYSQIGASYYIHDVFGINARLFNIGKSDIAGEAKIFSNKSEIFTEIDALFRFAPGKYHQLGFGLGLNMGIDYESYQFLLPISLEVFPFKEFKRASFLLELSPGMGWEGDDYFVRGLIGIRYIMGKHNRAEN